MTENPKPPSSPAAFSCALAALLCPIAAWLSQILMVVVGQRRFPAEVYLLAACLQFMLIAAGGIGGIVALLIRRGQGFRVLGPAIAGLILTFGTLAIIGVAML